jgi:ABC-2 type transport system ATP-binding protein
VDAAIALTGVTKRYGATTALDGLSFEAARGQMFGLIGPDGAGKTTAIRLICGLLHAEAGQVRVLGLDPAGDHRALTHKVGYLSQRFSLYGDLTIDENIAFFAEIHGVTDYAARRNHLLEMTQLTRFRDRLAERLSGGMKQKLALACTLVHQPQLVLLDEPTTGVDPVSRREFWKLLSHFLESGITILMSTPYLDEAERCHRVALVHNGRTLALDTPGRLRTSLPGVWIEAFPDDARTVRDRLRTAGHPHVEVFGERLHVWMSDAADEAHARRDLAALAARAGIAAFDGRVITPTLEDVFIARLAALEAAAPTGTVA